MKKNYLLAIISLICSMSIASCDKGSDDSEELGNQTYEQMKGEQRKFIGTWREMNDECGNFVFFTDGTCKLQRGRNLIDGKWTYSESSKELITTCDGWGFNIVMTDDDEWTGKAINSGRVVTFKRTDFTTQVFDGQKYANESDTIEFYMNNKGLAVWYEKDNFYFYSDTYTRDYGADSVHESVYMFIDGYVPTKMVVSHMAILNPYTPSERILRCTNRMKGVYKLVK